jgi:hypothetical protein
MDVLDEEAKEFQLKVADAHPRNLHKTVTW